MFSEENIERTKERLVEYVKDNADDFEWKNVYSEGEYSGYWECKFKQLSAQPINNAMQVFGIDSTMDIIVETLEDFYEDFYNDYDEDDYDYRGENILGNLEYEWFKQIGIKANDETESIVESENADTNEMVNHPPHYNQGKFETIDIIEDIVAGYDDPVEAYLVGTTIKYLARANFKGAKKQDLEKAEFYLKRAIDRQQ